MIFFARPPAFFRGVVYLCLASLVCHTSASAQTAPPLGQAGAFAVLGGSTVTNTGSSIVSGEVGVSPGSAITGFPPGVVVGGSLHFSDAQSLQAQADVVTAYNVLASQALTSDLTGQDLGGLTLSEGVYKFSSSAQLTGTLTLDAQGDPNAVFIFQIGSTLTTASGSSVSIINGGSNCRVFWQIGSSATLGTGTSFRGNILALSSITLNTNATIVGRLLARNGAVVLDSNTASICAECTPLTVSPATLPNATVGVPYSQVLTASGGDGTYTYAVSSGALPAGVVLSATGVISGTPSTIGSAAVTISVTDSSGCAVFIDFFVIVEPVGCNAISLLPVTLPSLVVGSPYSATLTASGGISPYMFSVASGSLPPGLVLSAASAASATLSGTPTTPGSYQYVILATDAAGCSTFVSYNSTVAPELGEVRELPSIGSMALGILAGLLAAVGLARRRRSASL